MGVGLTQIEEWALCVHSWKIMLQRWDGPYVGFIAFCESEDDAKWLAGIVSRQLPMYWLLVFGPSGKCRSMWVRGSELR